MDNIIKIAEIWSHNIANTKRSTIDVLKEGNYYYYIASNGGKGYKYKTLQEAKEDIKELWGNWIDFKLLI